MDVTASLPPLPGVYEAAVEGVIDRALSMLDMERVSPSRGSFDRTWWGWKFTDFSASRFQEGAYTLGWLCSSPFAPPAARGNERLIDRLGAALDFWGSLQHADGSFDEAYPFERSLAATAFTSFYCGSAIERARDLTKPGSTAAHMRTLERAAWWLCRNGEHHGILSNHLAAAAAALQVAGDVLGTDAFRSARDRYLHTIYRHQEPAEGWMLEYGGADPGYQSHGMFYLADIWRRTGDRELFDRLAAASAFMAWFAHPDGTMGGEYASRGTKFAFPAGFEILAPHDRSAAAIAGHLRKCIAAGRGVGPRQMDAWNLLPMLNNYLAARDHAQDELKPVALPWQEAEASRIFPKAGLAVVRAGNRLVVASPGLGGSLKIWNADGTLGYEDCGYAVLEPGRKPSVSQGESEWSQRDAAAGELVLQVDSGFRSVPTIRFSPFRFLGFRGFMLTLGRLPGIARALKDLLVAVLIRKRNRSAARLKRTITIGSDGQVEIDDSLAGLLAQAVSLERNFPIHMGSARYADLKDWLGASTGCPEPSPVQDGRSSRKVTV